MGYEVVWWSGIGRDGGEGDVISTHETFEEALVGLHQLPSGGVVRGDEGTRVSGGTGERLRLPTVRYGNHVRVLPLGDGGYEMAAYEYPKEKTPGWYIGLPPEEGRWMGRRRAENVPAAIQLASEMDAAASAIIRRGIAEGRLYPMEDNDAKDS